MKPSTLRTWKVYGLTLLLGSFIGIGGVFFWQLAERKTDWPWNYWSLFLPYALDLPPEHRFIPVAKKTSRIVFFGDKVSTPLGFALRSENEAIELVSFSGMSYARAIQWMINSIKKESLPSFVIVALGSEEWFEQKFSQEDSQELQQMITSSYELKNFLLWRMNQAWANKYYKIPSFKWQLPRKVTPAAPLNSDLLTHQKKMAITYLLKLETQILFQILYAYKIPSIILTAPINPHVGPKKKCLYGATIDVSLLWKEQKNLSQKKSWQEALELNNQLIKTDPFNPWTYHQRGQLIWKNGQSWDQAARYFQLSSILDCQDWRGNALFNQIITSQAKYFGLNIFEWEKFLYEISLSNEVRENPEVLNSIWNGDATLGAEALESSKELITALLNKFPNPKP